MERGFGALATQVDAEHVEFAIETSLPTGSVFVEPRAYARDRADGRPSGAHAELDLEGAPLGRFAWMTDDNGPFLNVRVNDLDLVISHTCGDPLSSVTLKTVTPEELIPEP